MTEVYCPTQYSLAEYWRLGLERVLTTLHNTYSSSRKNILSYEEYWRKIKFIATATEHTEVSHCH
jgi:hypothetical protein